VVAIGNVNAAIDQIAQTALWKVVGQHTFNQALSRWLGRPGGTTVRCDDWPRAIEWGVAADAITTSGGKVSA
jgi:hypothetical protein